MLKAPFPYFGGKSKIAGAVWQRFGDVQNYVEPFCGSATMLLARPD
jgi:DNA adenine methylase